MIPGNSKEDGDKEQWFDDQAEALAEEFMEQPEIRKLIIDSIAREEAFSKEFEKFCERKWEGLKEE